jgi:hypothetical protein
MHVFYTYNENTGKGNVKLELIFSLSVRETFAIS